MMLGSAVATFPSGEILVDPHLGYPQAFAKLCHNNPGLFPDSPPQCFLPYSISAQNAAKLRELDSLFPCNAVDQEKDDSTLTAHSDFLWSQLEHLGNAGFDPAKFRVDPYGNVLHRNADPSSPLAWVIDHWFPLSRGGKTRVENLRLVQWQVAQSKGQRLEFLVPWWDFQLGISVNQFLSVFASNNADFRWRAFSLLFHPCNNSNYSELESHYWPQHFKQKVKQDGLAAAAVVKIRKHKSYQYNSETTVCKFAGVPISQQWGAEDEEVLLKALQKYNRPVEGVEREEQYRNLPDTEKVQLNNGCEEELKLRHLSALSCMQQEKEAGEILCMNTQQAQEQVAQLEKELKVIKQQNEKEKAALEELENILGKHKKRIEKQRRWSETQLHYRQCLERIIRDTLHQNSVFKEKARLNQAACTALLAKIQSQRMSCEDAELDLAKQSKERETLEILAKPNLMEYICRRLVEEGFLNNKWSVMDQQISDKVLEIDNSHNEKRMHMLDKHALEDATQKMAHSCTQINESRSKPPSKCTMDTILEEDEQRQVDESLLQIQKSPLKRKVTSGELDVHVGYACQRQKIERIAQECQTDQNIFCHSENVSPTKLREDKQLEELLQEVLTLKDKSEDVAFDEENEENRITRLGKVNVDRWLQKLLLNDISKQCATVHDEADKGPAEEKISNQFMVAPYHDELASICITATGERPKKGLGGLFRRMGFRHHAKKLKFLKENVDSALEDARLEELATIPCYVEHNKADYNEERRSIKMEMAEADSVRPAGLEVISNEREDATPSELEFVKRMRELKERDKVKQSKRRTRLSNADERQAENVCAHVQPQHMHHPEKNVKEAKLEAALNNPNGISSATCLSTSAMPDRLMRSYSMRTTSSGGHWVLHTRKGSDVFPSSMKGDPMGEEIEIVLQSSSSFRREDIGFKPHCNDNMGEGTGGLGSSMGLKASLKTCTKAWKRVVSKRSS